MKCIILDTVGSTNIEASRRDLYGHGDAVIALEQTAGRGQRGNRWSSRPGENLTFSLVVEPAFLETRRQFLLSECTALALTDTFSAYGVDARIKWTNDIYADDRKIVGVLLEHDLAGDRLARSVIGIGINVNQTDFPDWLPNPTSLALLTGRSHDIMDVFRTFSEKFEARYDTLAGGGAVETEADYNALLYRLGEPAPFRLPGGSPFTGIIRGVRDDGTLLVESEGIVKGYLFREIEFIIAARDGAAELAR